MQNLSNQYESDIASSHAVSIHHINATNYAFTIIMNKLLIRSFAVCSVLLILTGFATAQASAPIPAADAITPKGISVIAADWRAAALASASKPGPMGSASASPQSSAVTLTTLQQPPNLYNLQIQVFNEIPLKKGDTMLIRFAARSLKADRDTGSTKLKFGFSKSAPNYDISTTQEVGVSAEWERFDVPFVMKGDFAPREARFSMVFGYPAQIAEIADLQVLRFGPDVALSALPKTKRFADKVAPEVVASELARIAAMRKALDEVKNPSPANGRTLRVEVKGSASGNGSASAPFATITQALRLVQPGDTILVGEGTYVDPQGINVNKSGRPDAWIKIKAAPGARPKLVSSNWSGIALAFGIGYVEIDGFELEWVRDPSLPKPEGAGISPMYATHHIRILNNDIHGFGTAGIGMLDSDYIHVEGNVLHNNAKTSHYGGSCISLCRSFNADNAPGYHNVVRKNVCYDNELKVSVSVASGGNGQALTDGNGIIIDVFDRSRADPLKKHTEDIGGPLTPYYGRTLVENNLLYDNGGRGIHIFRSSRVDVINNTTYMNQKSADINAGEYTAIEAHNVVFLNNIGYALKGKRANSQDGSAKVIWKDNLFFNYTDALIHDGIIEADPLFISQGLTADAATTNFRLKPGSPALGKGNVEAGARVDMNGKTRPQKGPIDLGAYQLSGP
jgi:parallel beta-helix repeat protein